MEGQAMEGEGGSQGRDGGVKGGGKDGIREEGSE